MSNTPFNARANAYIDGEMSAAETASFEAEMRADPALARAVDDVRTAEAGLRELFGEAPEVPDPLAAADAAPGKPRRSWALPAVAAAAIIAALGVRFLIFPTEVSPPPSDSLIYRVLTSNFEPAVVCDTPAKFAEYTDTTMGETINADFASASDLGISLIGWDVFGTRYDEERTKKLPRVLLVKGPGGTEIVVYFRARSHSKPEHDPSGVVRMFTKKFGRITAYEITPLEEPIALDLLSRD